MPVLRATNQDVGLINIRSTSQAIGEKENFIRFEVVPDLRITQMMVIREKVCSTSTKKTRFGGTKDKCVPRLPL